MKRHLALLSLTFVLIALSPASAGAAAPRSDAATYRAVFGKIEALGRTGASQAAIDWTLEREFGWVRLTGATAGVSTLAASASDVTFYTPTIYRNVPANRYEVTAKWQWKNCGAVRCWMAGGYPNINGNVGGPDAFALNVSRDVDYLSTSFVTYDEDGAAHHYSNPDIFQPEGVGFTEQDRQHIQPWDDFTWDHGTLVFSFRLASACSPGQIWKFTSKMGHTWQSTSISSMTITNTGISMTFTNAESRWTGISPSPLNWRPCG